jgi:hypothetical protein
VDNLADEILLGSTKAVIAFLDEDPTLVNEPDQYGYTPLIESIIAGKPDITQFLIERGADVNGEDMLGQTPLYWAIGNADKNLCALLLKKGADPNHHTAEGEPLLVKPILRQQTELLELLDDYKADRVFAEDYIQAKLMGHRYELIGQVDIVNPKKQFVEIDFEGFLLEFTIDLIRQSLLNFINAVAGARYPNYAHVLGRVTTALRISSELISLQYTRNPEKYATEIRHKTENSLFMVPVAYQGHAITFVRYRNFFAKCDRGVSPRADTVIIYEMTKAYRFDQGLIKTLLYQPGKSKQFINKELKEILGLKPLTTLPTRYQIAGNCSWANVEACVPTMMFMLLAQGDIVDRQRVPEIKSLVMNFYSVWLEWDKDTALDHCIAAYAKADRVRKASFLDILGAIFVQRCRPDKSRELARAKKILPLLLTPDYHYILDAYLRTYSHRHAGPLGERFMRLLVECGAKFAET